MAIVEVKPCIRDLNPTKDIIRECSNGCVDLPVPPHHFLSLLQIGNSGIFFLSTDSY